MYTFSFETMTSDLNISVYADDYKEAIDKIREMGIPELKKGHLKLVEVFESYDDAMYFDAGIDDMPDVENSEENED